MTLIEAREISKDYHSGANLQATRTLQPTSVLIEKGEMLIPLNPLPQYVGDAAGGR